MSEDMLELARSALGDRYSIDREIGRGGLGTVFLATDLRADRTVALKVLHRQLTKGLGLETILRELAFAARLSHPNILPILDTGASEGMVFYVAPHVSGGSLQARLEIKGSPLATSLVLQIADDVAKALSYAHAHNVLHRDLNPANIMLEDGHAIVKDFWIARALAVARNEKSTAYDLGLAAYLSPEQMAMSPEVDARSDVYSLACLVYEMLTGTPAMSGPWAALTSGDRLQLLDESPDIPKYLVEPLTRALSKSPDERFETPRKFIDAFNILRVDGSDVGVRAGLVLGPLPTPEATDPDIYLRELGAVKSSQELPMPIPRAALKRRPPDVIAPTRSYRRWSLLGLISNGIAALVGFVRRLRRKKRVLTLPTSISPTAKSGDVSVRLRKALRYRYDVGREVGMGGMAIVFLAHDLRYKGRKVALKVLRPELTVTIASERFLMEIEIAAQMVHPQILPLFDSGDADGMLFYSMPYLEGESLRQRVEREGQLPIVEAIGIVRDVASALDYAHRQGVIHRDIKPENILLYEGRAYVADFGIALAMNASGDRKTEPGFSPGTPEYMSPEAFWDSESIDHRSDLYGLACVLYEMLAGQPPYTAPTPQALAAKHLNAAVPHIRALNDAVPLEIDAALHRALAKVPAERFDRVSDLTSALSLAH